MIIVIIVHYQMIEKVSPLIGENEDSKIVFSILVERIFELRRSHCFSKEGLKFFLEKV